MKSRFCAIAALCLGAGSVASAADVMAAFDPLTVKVGEEMRITLFNPSAEPLEVRVFAYNAQEGTYDEGPSFTLAAGKLRFFDFKAPKEFVGLGGVIEVVPDKTAVAPSRATASGGGEKTVEPTIILEDILVSSVKSRGSLQHRSAAGQSQTMGYSFGGSTPTGSFLRMVHKSAQRVISSNWVASPEY